MEKNKKFAMLLLILSSLLGILALSTYLYINDSNNKSPKKISVIVYGASNDRWATLKRGIDQGTTDFGIQVNFVTMSLENDVKEQEDLLRREIENGAEGIVLAVTDSKNMSAAVSNASLAVPIVTIETNVEDVIGITYISADNYSMGLNIGRSVLLNNSKDAKIAIIMSNQQRDSVFDRYQGLIDCLQNTQNSITLWEMGENDYDPSLFIQKMMKDEMVDVIIALDDSSLESVVDVVEKSKSTEDVYGIGSTNKIVHYLDSGVINSIVYQNEFNMGYLSIQELMNHLDNDKKAIDNEIDFRTVNRKSMYMSDNQRLLFPIVQ